MEQSFLARIRARSIKFRLFAFTPSPSLYHAVVQSLTGEGTAFTIPSPPRFTFHLPGEGSFTGEGKGEGTAFTRKKLIFK